MQSTRRGFLRFAGLAGAAVGMAACTAPGAETGASSAAPQPSALQMPSSPVTLNLVDVSGDLVVAQPMIEAYKKQFPQYLANVVFDTGDATEIAGKLKAQQDAGVSQIDIVLTGNDALGAGIEQGLWLRLAPDYDSVIGASLATYQDNAKVMQQITDGYGVVNDYGNYGPLIEFMPDKVPNPPTSAADLMDWAKANPGQFLYARPSNSGPGRAFTQGLPYILGDSNPSDPVNGWAKTWAYLAELGKYIPYYTAGTGASMRELAAGTRKIIVSSAGWDINPRAIGTVPAAAQVVALDKTTWIMDSNFIAIPKGVSKDKLAVLLDLIKFMLTPEQQAKAYDDGYMYPGPSVKGVTLDMAPQASQDVIKNFGRTEYEALIAKYPVKPPLGNTALAQMFDKWDREIGANMVKQ
jgi:putative spermidine/putrescine transport system substrate-binding protein